MITASIAAKSRRRIGLPSCKATSVPTPIDGCAMPMASGIRPVRNAAAAMAGAKRTPLKTERRPWH